MSDASTPRSYIVSTPCGQVCRNRQDLSHRLNTADDNVADIPDAPITTISPHTPEPQRDKIMARTQTGINIRPPID